MQRTKEAVARYPQQERDGESSRVSGSDSDANHTDAHDEEAKLQRALIDARREVRSNREEREREARENERRRRRERMRWKLEQEKLEEEREIARLEERRRARKKATFQIALMTRRRETRTLRNVFRAMLLYAVRRKEMKIRKQMRERRERAEMAFGVWSEFCQKSLARREERAREARSLYEFRISSKVVTAWKKWTQRCARARAGKLAERRMKNELRAQRVRDGGTAAQAAPPHIQELFLPGTCGRKIQKREGFFASSILQENLS